MRRHMIWAVAAWLLCAAAGRADNDDFQVWLDGDVNGALSENWSVKFQEEGRYMDDASDLRYHHTDLGFSYKATSWFVLGLNYRQAYSKSGDAWTEENRPHLNGTVKWKIGDLKMSDRSRVEVRIRDGRDTIVRYRNLLTATCPYKIGGKFNPYLADELFIDSDTADFNINRVYAGLSGTLAEHLTAKLYYCWQTRDIGSTWANDHAVGIYVGIPL